MPHKIENIIKDLVKKEQFSTQVELVQALKQQGVKVKQSTVSRALQKLGAVKRVGSDGSVAYRMTPDFKNSGRYNSVLVRNIISNEAMVVVNTRSGSAAHVAQYIDEQKLDTIMGTIAGDNCILILPTTVKKIDVLTKQLDGLFPTPTGLAL